MGLIADRMAVLGTENAFKVGEDIARAEKRGVNVIRFTLGEPDFASPEHVNQTAIDNILKGNTHYVDPAGLLSYREGGRRLCLAHSGSEYPSGSSRCSARGQAGHWLLGDLLRQSGRRGDLSQSRISNLRIVGDVSWGQTGAAAPSAGK